MRFTTAVLPSFMLFSSLNMSLIKCRLSRACNRVAMLSLTIEDFDSDSFVLIITKMNLYTGKMTLAKQRPFKTTEGKITTSFINLSSSFDPKLQNWLTITVGICFFVCFCLVFFSFRWYFTGRNRPNIQTQVGVLYSSDLRPICISRHPFLARFFNGTIQHCWSTSYGGHHDSVHCLPSWKH